MEFFASDEQLAQLEAQLLAAEGQARLPCLVAVAWAIRQRDCARALVLADEAEALLAALGELAVGQALRLRFALVQGEVKWLFGELEASLALAEQAVQGFAELGGRDKELAALGALGCADAHWLLAWLDYDKGHIARGNAHLEAMADLTAGWEPVRHVVAQAQLARSTAFSDVGAARERWASHFGQLQAQQADFGGQPPVALHPAAECWIEDFWGLTKNQTHDYVAKLHHFDRTCTLALASGQIRRGIIAMLSIGNAFNNLNDHHTALDHMNRALALARQHGWSGMIGAALKDTAETLRHLQRHDAAYELLQEALTLLAPLTKSHHYAIALQYLGDVELARGAYKSALDAFQLLEARAIALNTPDLRCAARRGQAQAWLHLGHPKAALQAAQESLSGAHNRIDFQILALRVLAQIHTAYTLPTPPDQRAINAPLHYLQQALALSQQLENNTIPSELLGSLAHEYAKLGNYRQAWEFGQQAVAASERIHSREASNRAQALQITLATAHAEAEAAHQRQLAAAQTERAAVLQQTSDTLTQLGMIGQEITAHLDAQHVFATLHHHVQHLFDATAMTIFLMGEDDLMLYPVFAVEDNQSFQAHSIGLNHPISNNARCARERRAILANYDPATGTDLTWLPGSRDTRCAIFSPLLLADRLLGVMSIQSTKPNAYGWGEREQMIFRTLCAYTAIALSNAEAHGQLAKAHTDLAAAHTDLALAHRQLQDTQQQLVLQGKMAGLGSLTAGVAHEINNPTNFAHVAAQNMAADIGEFRQYVTDLLEADDATEIVQGFEQRFGQLERNVGTMLNGTERIKGIVRDLRAFTRMDSEKKRPVRLSECLTSTLNLVRTSWLEKVEFITELEPDPEIACWPALLNQVFMNLLVNGCQAIEARQLAEAGAPQPNPRGKLWLRLFRQGNLMLIEFEDSGTGISPDAQARIMEPFYTTKEVGKGTGLGLSIAFDIIQKHGGTLSFSSLPGQGSCFTIQLPLA